MTERIRAEARKLGFAEVGFTSLAPPDEGRHLKEWLKRVYHGEMAYMERNPEERADAQKAHPWGRTMICLIRPYLFSGFDPVVEKGAARVSLYALGEDYHLTIGRDLKSLGRFLEGEFGARYRLAVDYSAILERPYARNAGLGWLGKNTLLLSKHLGSYFFLAELVTDLELELDATHENEHCGQCTSCLDLCPTKAFVAPYVLDSRRCISYLTIEHRGVIPRDLRPLIGGWIFGCDVCQEVCPWNKYAVRTKEEEFRPRSDLNTPELGELIRVTPEEFRARFRKSPVWRAHRDGFVRNVAVALGNIGGEDAITPLGGGLNDPSWLVRLHSAWALGRLMKLEAGAQEVLVARRDSEPDPRVLSEIEWAFCYDVLDKT